MERKVNRIAVVTGGCGPLGTRITTRLADAGLTVIAADLPSATDAASFSTETGSISTYAIDLTDSAALDGLVADIRDEHGALDVLIHNAAFTGSSALRGWAVPFDEQSDEAFDAALQLNLAVPFRLTRRALPLLRSRPGGCIVMVASIYGLVGPDLRLYTGTGMGNPAGYAAAKGGLVQLTRYLAAVLAPAIRVNAVAPGGLARGQDPAFVQRYVARTPLGRMGTEDDVTEAITWLSGMDSAYVTGQVLAIDGGWTAR